MLATIQIKSFFGSGSPTENVEIKISLFSYRCET